MSLLLERAHAQHRALSSTISAHEHDLLALAKRLADCIARNGRIFFFGNGGSACDAMHIAGEFVGRFVDDRRALPAIALSADSGILTAVANDYSYDYVFARQIEALCHEGDIAIGLSTSGTSANVVRALKAATERGAYSVMFTGEKAQGKPASAALTIMVASSITAHVQEVHMFLLHSLTALTEDILHSRA